MFWSPLTNSNFDPKRPPIYVLLASDGLMASLIPSLKHLASFAAASNQVQSQPFKRLLNMSDELSTLVVWLLNRNSLVHHECLMSEHFYGLSRKRRGQGSSLAVHVLIPYIKLKLQWLYEKFIVYGEWNVQSNTVKEAVRVLVPMITMLFDGLDLWLKVLYSTGRSKYHSVLHWLDGSELQWSSPERAQDLSYLSVAVNLGSFALQFLSLWRERRKHSDNLAIPTPEAPHVRERQSKCPICRSENIQTPTILTVCGHVFCFKCIAMHLEKSGKCPITRIEADATNLVRIF